jgi:LPS export ABC transporter protein LptC
MKIFFAFLFLAVLISSCSENKIKPVVNSALDETSIPTQESWDSKIIFTEEGLLRAILYTDHLMVFEDKGETLLENVKIDFYNKKGKIESVLTSKRGRVDDRTKDMFAIDSVVAVSDSGVTLRTDELEWVNKTKKIKTDRFVRIESEEEIIEGYGFESDQFLRNYEIYEITYTARNTKKKL